MGPASTKARQSASPVDLARFRYASGGQGAAKRQPPVPPRSGGSAALLSSSVRLALRARLTAEVPGPPSSSCTAFLSSPASLRRKAPPGDLAPGMRCAQRSRRPALARIPYPHPSCAAFLRRAASLGQSTFGRSARRNANALQSLAAFIHQGSLPSPSLRRICRRQGPAAYASTRATSPLGKAGNTTRHGYLRQEHVTPNARHPRGLRPQPEITA